MFDYNIYANNSVEKFKEACKKIEEFFPDARKDQLLIDVDGTMIQNYTENSNNITVYNDYEIGAVFIESEVDLNKLFSLEFSRI